jgi:hypothetical protein
VDLVQKEDEGLKALSQRVDRCEQSEEAQKTALQEHGVVIEREGREITVLKKALKN